MPDDAQLTLDIAITRGIREYEKKIRRLVIAVSVTRIDETGLHVSTFTAERSGKVRKSKVSIGSIKVTRR